jgi:hypothetical protein
MRGVLFTSLVGSAELGAVSAPSVSPQSPARAEAFQSAMRRAEGQVAVVASPDQASAPQAGHQNPGAASHLWESFVESVAKRDKKLRTVFAGDPSRPETVVDALNFMQRHQNAMLEFHAILQVADNLKNGVNKLTNLQ